MCRTIPTLVLLAAVAGCATSTPVAITDKSETIANTSDVVVNCTVTAASSRWNFNFAENYLGPMPTHVAGGSVTDVSLRIDSVVKGSFDKQTIRIKDAQTPSQRETNIVYPTPDAIRNEERLVVGFSRGLFGIPYHYVIAREQQSGT